MKRPLFYVLQLSWLMLGLFIYGLSIVFIVRANLGVSPWDVLHLGLARHLPLSFGQVMIGAGFFCIVLSLTMGIKPRAGTVLNMIFIGVFTDLIMAWELVSVAEDYIIRALYICVGVICCGLATGVYITADMGTGPRDSLMMGLNKMTGWRIGLVRTLIELSVTLLGFLLGGSVGIGTLFFSMTIGFTAELFLNLFYWCRQQVWFTVFRAFLGPEMEKRESCT